VGKAKAGSGGMNYRCRKWLMRAETAHRKLVALAEDIEAVDAESELFVIASSAHCEAFQLVNMIKGASS
jgi:hypothetical protein